jgi:hypothetical protein
MTYATAKRFNLLNYTSAIVTRQDLNPFTSLVPSCPIKALKVLYNSPQLLGIVLLSKSANPFRMECPATLLFCAAEPVAQRSFLLLKSLWRF